MIAWLPGLRRLPLENDPFWTAWGEWLSIGAGGEPPKRSIELRIPAATAKRVRAARPLAPQTGTRLVFLDHNLAFDAALDVASTKRRARVLRRVERFSRAFVATARALGRDDLERILGVDERGAPLLDAARIDAVLARRDELVAWVDELVAKHGEAQVLCFE